MDTECAVSTWMGPLPQRRSQCPTGTLFALRHVIDLHAQAPQFFLTLIPSFTICIPVKRGPCVLLTHTFPRTRKSEKENKCVLIERPCGRGFLVQSRRDMCGERMETPPSPSITFVRLRSTFAPGH
jgi:hypothetical protein